MTNKLALEKAATKEGQKLANGDKYGNETLMSKSSTVDREMESMIWIAENQLGRCNLSKAARIELASRRAELLRAKKPINVRKTIAEAAGVSEQTVYRYMKIIECADADTLEQLRRGEIRIGTVYEKFMAESRVIYEV